MAIKKGVRADIFSFIIVVIVMLAVIIAIYFISMLHQGVITELRSNSEINSTSTKSGQVLVMMDGKPIQWGDMTIVFVYFGWFIALIIAGLYTDFNPAIMIMFFIILLFIVWMQMQVANMYDALSTQTQADIGGGHRFRMADVVFRRPLPLISLIVGIIVMIVIYAKRGESNY